MMKLQLFLSFVTKLQQFKCNEYGTKWCSIEQLTNIPELNWLKVSNLLRIPAFELMEALKPCTSRIVGSSSTVCLPCIFLVPGGGFHPDRVSTFRQLSDRLFSFEIGCSGTRGRSLDAGMMNSGGVQSTTSEEGDDFPRLRSTDEEQIG